MGRKKIIYFSLLFILVVICTITYFSYAFLIKTEEHHGKLNIVTGTLKYGLTSENLTNNSITVEPGKTEFNLVLRSLNNIDSKYQLYYQAATGVTVGYPDTNLSLGTIQANDQVTIQLVINNTTSSNQTVTFGVEGGFTGNTLVLSQGTAITEQISICNYTVGQEFTFNYTGSVQPFSPECDGLYKLETWGAQGGSEYNTNRPAVIGGYGGYSSGITSLNSGEDLYIFVGQEGLTTYSKNGITAGIVYSAYPNGGAVMSGNSSNNINFNGGGGSTHIAKENKLISELSPTSENLLIVAGGGGGVANWWDVQTNGGSGGGYIGASTTNNFSGINATGGTQSEPGLGGGNQDGHNRSGEWLAGKYGIGGGKTAYNPTSVSGAGGGGYYGGGASWGGSGAGGSGYIANTSLAGKSMYCYGCTEDLTNESTFTVSTTGSSAYKDTTNCPNGYSQSPISKCAKSKNGYAKITYLGGSNQETVILDQNGLKNGYTLTASEQKIGVISNAKMQNNEIYVSTSYGYSIIRINNIDFSNYSTLVISAKATTIGTGENARIRVGYNDYTSDYTWTEAQTTQTNSSDYKNYMFDISDINTSKSIFLMTHANNSPYSTATKEYSLTVNRISLY